MEIYFELGSDDLDGVGSKYGPGGRSLGVVGAGEKGGMELVKESLRLRGCASHRAAVAVDNAVDKRAKILMAGLYGVVWFEDSYPK